MDQSFTLTNIPGEVTHFPEFQKLQTTSQCGEINGAKYSIHGCKSLWIIHGDNNDPIFFQNYLGPNGSQIGEGGKSNNNP